MDMIEKQVTNIEFIVITSETEFEKVSSEEYCYQLLKFIFYCEIFKHS